MSQQIVCPHCGAMTPAGAFCESCGKALPTVWKGPRVVGAESMPTTSVGREMVGDELTKQMKRAANTLLGVGILQLTCGAILIAVLYNAPQRQQISVPVLLIAQFVTAMVFIGLYFWARRSPLPASIVGLVIYATLVTINVISSVTTLSQSGSTARTGLGGLGIGWLDIVIMVLLARGISAALKYKRLLAEQ